MNPSTYREPVYTGQQTELKRLQAENVALKLVKEGFIKRKKINGAIQVFGVRDTPITLLPYQWEQLAKLMPSVQVMVKQWEDSAKEVEVNTTEPAKRKEEYER